MRVLILVTMIFMFNPYKAISQVRDGNLFFNEIGVSLNRTMLENDNTLNRNGYGVVVYRTLTSSNKFNIVFGLSYDKTSQFKKEVYDGHFSSISDVVFEIHNFSVPFNCRFSIGSKLYVETGVFTDVIMSAQKKGHYLTSVPNEDIREYEVTESLQLFSPNYGFSIGVAMRIPITDSYGLTIKPDFKVGLRNLSASQESINNRYFRLLFLFDTN